MKIFGDVLMIRRLVCLLARGELPDDAPKVVDITCKGTREEISGYNKRVAKDYLCRGDVEALPRGCTKTKEDARQL